MKGALPKNVKGSEPVVVPLMMASVEARSVPGALGADARRECSAQGDPGLLKMATSDSYPSSQVYRDEGRAARRGEAVLEVRPKEGGMVATYPLEGNRIVVGRDPSVGIRLNGEKVSRYHAEFVRSSDGVWWIHDLNSTNGIRVNGADVNEKILSAGDAVEVGDVWLVLRLPGFGSRSPAKPTMPAQATRSDRSLKPQPTLPVSAAQSVAAHRLIRELQHTEATARRRELMCEQIASEGFAYGLTWVVRCSRQQLEVVHACRPGTTSALPNSERRWLARRCLRQLELLLSAGSVGQWTERRGKASETVLFCVLSDEDGMREALCVEVRASTDVANLRQVLCEVADGEHQAAEVWRMRNHIRRNAVADYELSMATQIQQSLVPKSKTFGELELEFGFQPCRSVGGDYVDALPLKDGRVLLGVADVCGKGLQASLIASSLHTLVHVLTEVSSDVPALVQRINRHLLKYLPDHSFVTAVFVAVDLACGALECVSAGHPPALIVNASGAVRRLRAGENLALGMIDFEPQAQTLTLLEHETLLMYTDGLSEASDPEGRILGVEELSRRCAALIGSAPGAELSMLSMRLRQSIAAYRGGLMATDDAAFLLARYQRNPADREQTTLPAADCAPRSDA